MNFPKLKTRPRSTHTVFRFGGLWHSDEAPVGMKGRTVMRWQDLRNLGPDKYPMMSRIPDGTSAVEIDGCTIKRPLIAAAEGKHPVFLDDMGVIHCNGHKKSISEIEGMTPLGITYHWEVTYENFVGLVSVSPETDTSYEGYEYSPYMQEDDAGPKEIVLRYDAEDSKWRTNVSGTYAVITPLVNYGATTTTYVFATLGITVVTDDDTVMSDWFMRVKSWATSDLANNPQKIVRIGAYAVIYPYRVWINTEALAESPTLTEGVDYGSTDALLYAASPGPTLTMCDIDGNPYTGIVAQATAPDPDNYKYWIDTSGDQPSMMEYSVSMSMWVVLTGTYVKIENIHVTAQDLGEYGSIKAGDTVDMFYPLPDGTDQAYIDLMNGYHYIYGMTGPDANGVGSIIVSGVIPDDTKAFTDIGFSLQRELPIMDYMVECGNRLWGCRYGMDVQTGEFYNEIYASKLGDFKNWRVFQGLSTDSWAASRGTPAPYTGAAVLDGHPLFFREESLEKVYPSSTGAHQIQTFTVDGVQEGSDRSLVIIDDRLYYQSRLGVCVYDGTLPRKISQAFGDLKYTDGIAARHKKRYEISMVPSGGGDRIVGVYDTGIGEWYLESSGWDCLAFCWKDELYSSSAGNLYIWKRYSNTASHWTWYAESGVIGYELPEHRYISCVQIRMRSQLAGIQTTVKVKIMYDDSGTWVEKGSYALPNTVGSREANIFPRRCDHFRIRIEGTGGADILSMSFRMERSEGGH